LSFSLLSEMSKSTRQPYEVSKVYHTNQRIQQFQYPLDKLTPLPHSPHFTCKPGLKASKLVCIVSQPPTPKSNPSHITNPQAFLISKVSLHIPRSSQKSHTQMHTTITHRPPIPYPNPTQILAYPTNISKIFNDTRQAEISLP
jgi:hypothetical protein